jgi:antitoxin StbD
MQITNITEIRKNASKIVAKIINEKDPVLILQRSKPVAYIVEASQYESLKAKIEYMEKKEKKERTKAAVNTIAMIKKSMKKDTDTTDSVQIIRQLREGKNE